MNPIPARYKFNASETFWRNFHALSPEQKDLTRLAWAKFKENPFDARLRPHKIHALSARAGETILAIVIDRDLRVVFCVRGDIIYSIDIGTHSIYGKG